MKVRHQHHIPFEYNTKVISKATDFRIYRDATLLTPGSWTDMITNMSIEYTEKSLMKYATNWTRNILNTDHEWRVGSIIGRVENQRWQDGAVKGDLYIDRSFRDSEDVIAKIDGGYVNNLSVELKSEDTWDSDQMVRCACDIEFIGCAIIAGYGACPDSRIK